MPTPVNGKHVAAPASACTGRPFLMFGKADKGDNIPNCPLGKMY